MKIIFNKEKIILFFIVGFLLSISSSSYALPTIQYGYPKINQNLEECLSAASIALPKSGYQITQKTKQHVIGHKGKFFIATIVCATYKSGIAFIVVNGRGRDSNPFHEEGLVQKIFLQNIK